MRSADNCEFGYPDLAPEPTKQQRKSDGIDDTNELYFCSKFESDVLGSSGFLLLVDVNNAKMHLSLTNALC
jgi:hypothetical protein